MNIKSALEWFQNYRNLVCVLDRKDMSETVQKTLADQERLGAYSVNIFRYLIGLVLGIIAVNAASNHDDVLLNLILLSIFLGVTAIHSLILWKGTRTWVERFDYFALITDYLLIFGIPIIYSMRVSPDNFGHALKSPTLFLLIIPITLTALQFRLQLILVSFLMLAGIWCGLLFYGLIQNIPSTNNWHEYVLGQGVLWSDLVLRPIPFFILSSILAYISFRSISMIRRIGDLESRRASLARFFSPRVVETLSAETDVLKSGLRQKVTILFADIRDFTALSEKMDPEELADLLTEFRDEMTSVIFDQEGTLDKFIGDAIMATFGTPAPSEIPGRDSLNALLAAEEMLRCLERLNEVRRQKSQMPIHMGIGIHTGEVFCGTIGTAGRMEYTVIGDAVNTASRIESLCKKFQSPLLISDSVYKELPIEKQKEFKKLPLVAVKGKTEPLQIYSGSVSAQGQK